MSPLSPVFARGGTLLAFCAIALLAVDDLSGQRRRRFPGREAPRPEPRETPPPQEKEPKREVERWLAVQGGDVYLGTGQVVRRATVLIADDKIHAIGHDLELPEGTETVDAKGRIVAPGYVAVRARGFGEPSSHEENAADGVNAFHPDIKLGLAAGITSFLTTFGSGTDKPGGNSVVLKLAPGDPKGMVVAQDTVYTMRVPLNAKQWADLREAVDKAKKALAEGDTGADKEKTESKNEPKEGGAEGGGGARPRRGRPGGASRNRGGGDESIAKILQGKAVLWVSSMSGYSVENIRQALELARLFGHGVVLDNPTTGWVIPDEIAATGSMAILNPRERVRPDPTDPDRTGSNMASAAILADAGVAVAVTPPGGRFGGAGVGKGGILGQDLHTLHVDAAYAVRGGLDDRAALRTITADAARILGVGARIGSLEVGKDADLLILDGDPLHYRTFVETAVVNGKVVYEKDKEPFYRHIKR